MEYRHVLLLSEIRTGRLNFGLSHLSGFPDAREWFERHAGQYIAIYAPDGSLIKRSIRLDRNKINSWRFNCGIDTFEGKVPGNIVTFHDRPDGSLVLSFDETTQTHEMHLPDLSDNLQSQVVVANIPERSRPISARTGRRDRLGELLNFRGLQHAPVNEQGVVFLFGMVCREIGYLVEVVRSDYPDCQGKRLINTSPETWERVHIEFEYQSRNFLIHQHNVADCDVIVCWEHNWPECPIEVIELREEIRSLKTDAP